MRRPLFTLLMLILAAALFAGLALTMRRAQREAAAAATDLLDAPPPRPVADVASAVRAMNLVTVEIDAKVKVERGDDNWRGEAWASIEVPVRLHYGCDLSGLESSAVAYSPLAGSGYVVRIPRPRRIATEIFGAQESVQVRTGWLRLRSRAGEYYLGLARRDASDRARDLVLLPDDAARVERETRDRVAQLVRSIVGPRAAVEVVFAETP